MSLAVRNINGIDNHQVDFENADVVLPSLNLQASVAWNHGIRRGELMATRWAEHLSTSALANQALQIVPALITVVMTPILVTNAPDSLDVMPIMLLPNVLFLSFNLPLFQTIRRISKELLMLSGLITVHTFYVSFFVHTCGCSKIGVPIAVNLLPILKEKVLKRIYSGELADPIFTRLAFLNLAAYGTVICYGSHYPMSISARLIAVLSAKMIHEPALTEKFLSCASGALMVASVAIPMLLKNGKKQIKAHKFSTALDAALTATALVVAGTATLPALSIGMGGALAAKCVDGSITGGVLRSFVGLIPSRARQVGGRIAGILQQRALNLIEPYREVSLGMFC